MMIGRNRATAMMNMIMTKNAQIKQKESVTNGNLFHGLLKIVFAPVQNNRTWHPIMFVLLVSRISNC